MSLFKKIIEKQSESNVIEDLALTIADVKTMLRFNPKIRNPLIIAELAKKSEKDYVVYKKANPEVEGITVESYFLLTLINKYVTFAEITEDDISEFCKASISELAAIIGTDIWITKVIMEHTGITELVDKHKDKDKELGNTEDE